MFQSVDSARRALIRRAWIAPFPRIRGDLGQSAPGPTQQLFERLLVALLEPDAGEFSVPSKVLTYLCAGRAILGLMPATNAASLLVDDDASSGLVADDIEGFVSNAHRLAEDPALRDRFGASGRAAAEERFDVEVIAGDFIELLMPIGRLADGASRSSTSNGVLT